MKLPKSKRALALTAGALLVALYFVQPGAEWLRGRLVRAMGAALARRVEVGSISLRMLPRPGFVLGKLVVFDDPAFGAEPMVRSDEVTASVRLTSLLRGQLEISRLSLTEPSVNLVRSAGGRWNLESLLERAAQTQAGPTGKPGAGRRAGFPYIEADGGRINLKLGSEKKAYALTDADFSLWQESDDQWGMRLKAHPMRTDFNLSDTGTVRVDGNWQRAGVLRETPLSFSVSWDKAQLGQLTKLIYGNDKGWRGTAHVGAKLQGMPGDLGINAEASIEDFRRYDIVTGGSLKLAAACTGRYSTADNTLSQLACRAPAGDGSVEVAGAIAGLTGARQYNLAMKAAGVRAQSLAELLRRAKKELPDDLTATGILDAEARIEGGGNTPIAWTGKGAVSGLKLASSRNHAEISATTLPFTVASGEPARPSSKAKHPELVVLPFGARVEIGPAPVAIGKSTVIVQGWLARGGYGFGAEGDTQIQGALQAARLVGLPAMPTSAEGNARLELSLTGAWSGFAQPRPTGQILLRGVRASVRGLNGPVEIASASLTMGADRTEIRDISATVGDTKWHGWVTLPRPCTSLSQCTAKFDLGTAALSTGEIDDLFTAKPPKRPWYQLGSSPRPGPSLVMSLHAEGNIEVDHLRVGEAAADHVSAAVEFDAGKLRIRDLRAKLWGGKHLGEWTADFTAKPPKYTGSGTLQDVALDQVARAMGDGWVTGKMSGGYHAEFSGTTSAEMTASGDGVMRLDVRSATLPHLAIEGGMPLAIRRMVTRVRFRDGRFEVQEGKLETPNSIYLISGTANLNRSLNIRMMRDTTHGFNITGTVARPEMTATPGQETRAALKQ